MPVVGIAVAIMRKEDWPRWLSIDPDFQPDYDHWRKRIDVAIKEMRQRGTLVEEVVIDPDEFLEWSRSNGGKVNAPARATFASITLANRHGRGH
jgi:hypothetical protein